MIFEVKQPPRKFKVGNSDQFDMSDCGSLQLEPDEQVTFIAPSGAEYDIAKKDWGFYATPSLNGRLVGFGLRGVLIKNRGTGRYFVLLVEAGHEASFENYCSRENLVVVVWMDCTERLDRLAEIVGSCT